MNEWIKEIERLREENKKLKGVIDMRIKELRERILELTFCKEDIESDLRDNENEKINLEEELEDINKKLSKVQEEYNLIKGE